MRRLRTVFLTTVGPNGRFINDAAVTFASKAVNGLLVLATNSFLAHQLAPAGYGRYVLVFWISIVCGIAGTAGIYTAAPRFLSEVKAHAGDAGVAGRVWTMMRLLVIAGPLAGAISVGLLCSMLVASGADATALMIALTAVGVSSVANAVRYGVVGTLRGLHRLGPAARLEATLPNGIFAAGLAVAWLFSLIVSELVALFLLTVANVAAAIWSVWVLRSVVPRGEARPDVAGAGGAMLRTSLPFMIISVVGLLSDQLTIWLIAWLGPVHDVAIYSVGLQIYQTVNLAFVVCVIVSAPRIAALIVARDPEALRTYVRFVTTVTSVLAILSVGCLAIVAPWLVLYGFGATYGESAQIALILCAGRLVQIVLGPGQVLLPMAGLGRVTSWSALAATAVMAAAIVAIYPSVPVETIAWLAAAQYAAHGLLLSALVRWRLGFWPIPQLSGVKVDRS